MRTRLIALIVLILLVGVPTTLYWYFYKKNISSIIFLSESKEPFTVSLDGKLEYEYFPLLDQVFRYKSTCESSCIFSPIPPLNYTLRISTPGREDIEDTIALRSGKSVQYEVILPKAVFFEKIASMPYATPDSNMDNYISIGVTSKGKIIAIENKLEGGSVGVMNNGKFVGLFQSPTSLLASYLDESREFLISPNQGTKQSIYHLIGTEPGITFPTGETIIMVTIQNTIWKVRTKDNLYEYSDGNWKKHPRFTDYIDLNNRYRLGYISSSQGDKLRLQNYPREESLFLLLDRTSTLATPVKKGLDIQGFFFYEGVPSYLDMEGNIYRIELKGYE